MSKTIDYFDYDDSSDDHNTNEEDYEEEYEKYLDEKEQDEKYNRVYKFKEDLSKEPEFYGIKNIPTSIIFNIILASLTVNDKYDYYINPIIFALFDDLYYDLFKMVGQEWYYAYAIREMSSYAYV